METGLTALNQIAAIAGLGGIGKTQTAVEYAYRYFHDTHTYDWVFWVKADTELALVTGIADIARSLNLGDGNLDELAARAKRWLETNEHWLLICDNADQPQQIKSWLPRNPQGRILLTSRAQQFASLGIKAPLTVNKLSPEESIAFLCDRTNRPSLATDELAAATALARALDGLPLALEQAAAYLQRTGASFAAYWKHYQQQSLTLLEKGQPETGDYPQSVATTWLLNFEAVETRSPASVPILQLSAVLAPDDIPEQLLLICAEEFGLIDCTDELALGEQLAALADFSLIQRERETASYSIHRMVQDVVWDRLTTMEQQILIQRAVVGLCAAFPNAEEFENWSLCGQLVPHVKVIAVRLDLAPMTCGREKLLRRAGSYLKEQGRYTEAEPLYLQAQAIATQQWGMESSLTAPVLNGLAELYRELKQYEKAEALYVHVLQIQESQRLKAIALNNLGLLYTDQGRYVEAEPYLLEAIRIDRQLLGKEHPDLAVDLHNLALVFSGQERYSEAEALLVEVLQIKQRTLPENHPLIADTFHALGILCRSQNRFSEAEIFLKQALDIDRYVFGNEHHKIVQDLNHLALLYNAQDRYEEAEPLYVEALAIRKMLLGDRHPDTATSLNNLALLYKSQGRYEEAEPLYVEALAIRKAVLSDRHPDTASSLNNLAALYYRMGRYGEVLPLIEQAVQIDGQALPPDHPRTQNARGLLQAIQAAAIPDLPISDDLQ